MARINNVSAVLFDMDGTLVDSEPYTELSVKALCRGAGPDKVDVDCSEFDGVSWDNIALRLIEQLPQLAGKPDIAQRLHEIYHDLLKNDPPPIINKARETVIAAGALMPIAIVSSSHRESIEETIRRMAITDQVCFYAGADDYARAKPAPDGYLKAADALRIDVHECLVFEDSVPGVQAARNAGMQVVAITRGGRNINQLITMSDMAIHDFSDLDDDFFSRVTGLR